MPPPVTVAALAVADGPADAVGVVQLACEEDALAITLLRAGAYREGFVPGTLASYVTLRVPYVAVRGLVRRGRALVLTLDRSVPSPFHRFALARFTDDPAETLASLHRTHRVASKLSWTVPGPLGALAAALPPASLVGGALGRASLALLVALASGAAMRALAAWLAWGGPVSDRHRDAFEIAISERLGLLPAPMPRTAPALPRGAPAARSASPALQQGSTAAQHGASAMPARPSPDLRERAPHPRDTWLDPQEASPHLRDVSLGPQEAPVEPHDAFLDRHAASVGLHDTSLDPLEVTVDLRDASLDPHEASPHLRDTALDPHEASPHLRETVLDPREAADELRHTSLDPREASPHLRETALDPREAAVDLRDTPLDPREAAVDLRDTSLDPREAAVDLRDTSLDLHAASGELQEASGEPREASVDLRRPAGSPRRPMPASPPHIDLTTPAAPRVPWARLVGLAAVVALGAVSALVFVRRYGTTTAPAAPEIDDTVTAARGELPPKPPPPPPPPREERCICGRADSPLWRDGVPVLSVLTTTGPEGTLAPPQPKLDEHQNPVFQYDLAVVNNGAAPIRETRVVLTYARRDGQDRRIAVTDRGLYWGKPLLPGRAIKWVTEGPGTEVRIDESETGTLEERGIEPAPADAFFALTKARHRVVRMHAAMMLAYLHDPRAEEAITAIGAPVAEEAWTVRRIRAAARPVIACDVKAEEGRVSACVFNASTKPGTGLSLREIQDDEAKAVRAWPVQVEVPVHDGVRLAWPLEGDPPGDLVVAEGL